MPRPRVEPTRIRHGTGRVGELPSVADHGGIVGGQSPVRQQHLEAQLGKARDAERTFKRDLIQRKGELAESRMLAERLRGDTGEQLIGLLERRLDAVVYRAKFVPTIFAARQFVNHGHVTVNGKKVNIPSYRVKEGDVIEVRQKSKQLELVLVASQLPERDVPDYLEVDHSKMTATFTRTPVSRRRPASWSAFSFTATRSSSG